MICYTNKNISRTVSMSGHRHTVSCPFLGCTSCASRLPQLEKNEENLEEPSEQKLLNTGLDKGLAGHTFSTLLKKKKEFFLKIFHHGVNN